MARRKKTNEDDPKEDEVTNGGQDDSFGLPEVEYQPLNREEEAKPAPDEVMEETVVETPRGEETVVEETYTYSYEDQKQSVAPKVIGIIVVVLLAAFAAWYFVSQDMKNKDELAASEKAKQEQAAERQKQDALDQQKVAAASAVEQHRLDSLAQIPKEGTVETLSARTGRYYVVITSAVDDDLLMDYANKLSKNDVSTKVIPPFGKYKFFRLAVADGATFSETQAKADELKSNYGEKLWVLRY